MGSIEETTLKAWSVSSIEPMHSTGKAAWKLVPGQLLTVMP